MFNILKISLIILIISIFSPGAIPVLAQEDATETTIELEVRELIEADENIEAEDLEIKEPALLPGNPFYFFKNVARGLRSIITFDPIKKAELKLRFANERLIEIKKLAEKTDNPRTIEKALNGYENEIERIDKIINKARNEIKDSPKIDKFIDKFVDNQVKHQKLLGKIEKEIPEEVFEEIMKAKETAISSLANIPLFVKTPEEVQKIIVNIMEKQAGSDFKHFKNLELLKEIEGKVPEIARESIQRAQENTFNKLERKMEAMDENQRTRFSSYVEGLGGNEIRHLEIISEFESRKIPKIIREEIEKAKEKTMGRIQARIRGFSTEERKQEFLKHLEDGEVEDIRIIKELENNLPPDVIDRILEIKNRAFDNFRRDMKLADTPEKQEKFFQKMEKFHDVKQFEMFKEMDGIIPEDQKEFWEKMKEKAATEMKKDFDEASTFDERKIMFDRFAGDAPQHIGALKDFQDMEIMRQFGPPPEIMQEIMKEQVENLSHRIEIIEDVERLEILKQNIEQENGIMREVEKQNPNIFRAFEQREDFFFDKFSPEKAKNQIEKARELIRNAQETLKWANNNPDIKEILPAEVLLDKALKHLGNAQEALRTEKFGEAFGQATAAIHNANSVIKIIKEMEVRREFEDIDRIERGDISEEQRQNIISRCPNFIPSSLDFCPEGQIHIERTTDGCPGKPRCIKIAEEERLCAQVITPARKESGECREFPTSCIPEEWFRVRTCRESFELKPVEIISPEHTDILESTQPTAGDLRSCPGDFRPVCGSNGKTYTNKCFAEEQGVMIEYTGKCRVEENFIQNIIEEKPTAIPVSTKPIIEPLREAINIIEEYNKLETISTEPTSKLPEIICLDIENPVCGINGQTYFNECRAKKSGIAIKYSGKCR